MVVNKLRKPVIGNIYGEISRDYYAELQYKWREAEKKVIFKPGQLEIDNNGIWFKGKFIWFYTPLCRVAEITNGELELQNVEL